MIKAADGAVLIGMVCLVAGVYLLLGLGAALLTAGVCLILSGITMAVARASRDDRK